MAKTVQTDTEPIVDAVAGEEKITVHMTEEFLFDFFLYHTYSKLSGFLVNVLGVAIFFLGVYSYVGGRTSVLGCFLYLAVSAVTLLSIPVQLRLKAKKAMKKDWFKKPLQLTFTDKKGITAVQDASTRSYTWEQILRAVVTPKTISLYVSAEEAIVIPKRDFGTKFASIYQMIAVNLGMTRFTGH